jgi:DNA-binding transcriptional regulator/RsmH inhibitor MraZ
MVRDYLECLDTVWETDPQTRAREYRKLKTLIQYQLALFSPTPVAFSIMERNIQAENVEASKTGRILLPAKLQEKVELAAKQASLTPNETITEVLSKNIDRYLGQEKKEESEEADVVDT